MASVVLCFRWANTEKIWFFAHLGGFDLCNGRFNPGMTTGLVLQNRAEK
jgi:hypothetical protein